MSTLFSSTVVGNVPGLIGFIINVSLSVLVDRIGQNILLSGLFFWLELVKSRTRAVTISYDSSVRVISPSLFDIASFESLDAYSCLHFIPHDRGTTNDDWEYLESSRVAVSKSRIFSMLSVPVPPLKIRNWRFVDALTWPTNRPVLSSNPIIT